LALAVAAILKAFAGWFGRQPFGKLDHQLGQFYAMSLDLQVLLGLILWIAQRWWSPLVTGGMANPQTRFFAFEHPFVMILALGIAHMGRSLSRKAAQGASAGAPAPAVYGEGQAAAIGARGASHAYIRAHRLAALFFLASLVLVLLLIPWGGVPIR
jgi:hypothetical protein